VGPLVWTGITWPALRFTRSSPGSTSDRLRVCCFCGDSPSRLPWRCMWGKPKFDHSTVTVTSEVQSLSTDALGYGVARGPSPTFTSRSSRSLMRTFYSNKYIN